MYGRDERAGRCGERDASSCSWNDSPVAQDLNDLYYFAKVVDAGGFAAAGRALGIPKSRLSRRVLELETRLGVRLLARSTRKITLTDIGERYYRQCQAVLAAAEMAEETALQWTAEPRGRVRLSCPVLMSDAVVGPLLPAFLVAHPRVQLELVVTNRRVDLIEEGVDLAVRVRSRGDEDPSLVARWLRPMPSFLVAAPPLIVGAGIEAPEDLARMPLLGAIASDRKVHLKLTRGTEVKHVALEPRLGTEDFGLRKRAALAGLGITILPHGTCVAELETGALVRVLPEWSLPEAHLVLAYPHRRGLLPAVRALIDHLSAALGE